MENHIPKIETDGGPWAMHDVACPIHGPKKSSVLDLNTGIFHPSWKAQREGWILIKFPKWLAKFIRNHQNKSGTGI